MKPKTIYAIVSSLYLLSTPAMSDPVSWSVIWPTMESAERIRLGVHALKGAQAECERHQTACELLPEIEAYVTANAWYSDPAPGLTKRCLSRARELLALLLPAATLEAGKALSPAPVIDFLGVNDRIVAETDTETGTITLHPKACAHGDGALAFTTAHELGHLVISARGKSFAAEKIKWELKAEEVAATAVGIKMLIAAGVQFDAGSSPEMFAHIKLAEAIHE